MSGSQGEFLSGLRGMFTSARSRPPPEAQDDNEEQYKSLRMLKLAASMKHMTKREERSTPFDRLALLIAVAGNVEHCYHWPKNFDPSTRDAHVKYFNAVRDFALKVYNTEVPTDIVLLFSEFKSTTPMLTNSKIAKYAYYILNTMVQQFIFMRLNQRASALQTELGQK